MDYTPQQLADIEACRDAAKRYCRGLDRLDPDEMRSAYWPEATDDHGVFVGNAWEFVDRCMESHEQWTSTMHCIYNHLVELDPGGLKARGEIYNVSYLFAAGDADGERTINTWHGRYLDVYERRKGEWRILERVCVHEFTRRDVVSPMDIQFEMFRQGEFDRGNARGRIGP